VGRLVEAVLAEQFVDGELLRGRGLLDAMFAVCPGFEPGVFEGGGVDGRSFLEVHIPIMTLHVKSGLRDG